MPMYSNNKQANVNSQTADYGIGRVNDTIPRGQRPEAPNIHSSFEELGRALNFLSSTLETLDDRLQPVLTPSRPEAAGSESKNQVNVSPVQHNLNEIAASIRRMASNMLDITERLDV